MNTLEIKELPLPSKVKICWGFCWRGMLTTIGSTLCGVLFGGVIGFLFAMLGLPKAAISVVAGIGGFAFGILFFYFYVRWLLSSSIGNFKLVLVHADEQI